MELTLCDIYKSFGQKQVLRGITFTATAGRAMGLLGRNGAGKTTTLRILMGVFAADSGQVLLNGAPINRRHTKIGYLPEERGLYPKKPILEQLVYFAMLKGMDRRSATAACRDWLARLQMEEYANKRLEVLSKGNQQKIQLITALAHDPDIVILDEPFSGLDPVNAQMLKDVVSQQIALGKIVLFSSHQMNYIEEFCNDIAIIKDGDIALQGNLTAIRHSYAQNTLQITADNPAAIQAALGGQIKGDKVLLHTDNPHCTMQQVTAQFDVWGVQIYEPTLNDIFVSVAGDKEEQK